jgi:hypothetical protein
MPELQPMTKEAIEASWALVETTFQEAFRDVPCACPTCPGHEGN